MSGSAASSLSERRYSAPVSRSSKIALLGGDGAKPSFEPAVLADQTQDNGSAVEETVRRDSIDEVEETFEGKPKWRHDKDSKNCHGCGGKFTAFLRRHHCRGCGELYCNACSKWKIILAHLKYKTPVRCCQKCASPLLLRVSSVPTTGGEVVIQAYNVQNNNSPSPEVSVDEVACKFVRVIASGPPVKIRCSVLPGAGMNKTITVRDPTSALQGSISFCYESPVVQHCTRAPTTGGKVIVSGINLGPDTNDLRVFTGRGNHHEIPRSKLAMTAAHTTFECIVPPGSGFNVPIIVSVAGQDGEGTFTYESPVISDTSDVEACGGELFITGQNFGADAHKIAVSVLFDDWTGSDLAQHEVSSDDEERSPRRDRHAVTATKIMLMTKHTKLRCNVPAYPSRSGGGRRSPTTTSVRRARVIVQVHGQNSTPSVFAYLPPPPPTPPLVMDKQWSPVGVTKRLSFVGEDLTPGRHARQTSTTTLKQPSETRNVSTSSGNLKQDEDQLSDNEEKRVSELLRYKTEKPPASRMVRNHEQEAASAALLGFFGDARLEEARLAPLPSNWIPDQEAPACMLCQGTFSFFNRRHHCRKCGGVICGDCSAQRTIIGQYSLPVRLCDECFDLANMRSKMKTYVYEIRRLMALLPVEEGAEFRQEITLALDEGARYRAEQTIMIEEARANARKASQSWQARSASVNGVKNRPQMWFATPPRRQLSVEARNSSPRNMLSDRRNRDNTDSVDSYTGGVVLDVSLASPGPRVRELR
jgi:hypothetical protein